MFGRHTCFTPNGCSVVDYTIVSESILDQILFFHVSDFLATLSDCHCKLSWEMLANFTCSNNSYMLNPLPLKYIWNETSITDFQSAFERDEIKSKITSFINLSITDTQDATTQLNSIITDAANISLKKYSRKVNGQNTNGLKKKYKKNKKWFDADLKALRNRVISNGKLYSMFPKDPIVRGRYYKLQRVYNKTKKKQREVVQKTTVRAN